MASRFEKTVLNAKVNLIFNIISFLLSFFSRRIFLERLGTEFLGLSSTIGNLLNFLNLAELGVGAAISYILYKPLAEKNQKEINEIISIMGYFYNRIGLFVLSGGVVLSYFLPMIYRKSTCPMPLIYFVFYTCLLILFISYVANYRLVLLNADQKNYIVTAYTKSANILQLFLQMVFAYFIANPYLYILILFVCNIWNIYFVNRKISIIYPDLVLSISKGREYFRQYPKIKVFIQQIFFQKITGFASSQFTPMLIYAFISLDGVTRFTNYESVISKFSIITYSVFSSIFASVGNLIATSDEEKTLKVLKQTSSLSFIFSGLCLLGIWLFMDDFITLWIGRQYVLDKSILILFMANFLICQQAGIIEMFVNGYGLFSDIFAPIVESTIYLVIAIIGGKYWGMTGIFAGVVFSRCIIGIFWKIYYLFKRDMKMPTAYYWRFVGLQSLILIFSCWLCVFLYRVVQPGTLTSWWQLFLYAIAIVILYCVIAGGLMYFLSEDARDVLKRLISYAKSKYLSA